MAEERYGIETFFDTKEFDKGIDGFLRGLDRATQGMDRFTAQTGKAGAGGQLEGLDAGLAIVTGGISGLATAISSQLLNAFTSLTGTITEATDAMIAFGVESLQIAGKVDELQRSALYLGQQAGYTNDQMLGFFDSLEETGIRADVSGQLLSQLARYQIDLAKATDLANVAQNAGILVGRDSSDVLESLTQAAVTNQVEVARSAGIIVNFTAAQDKLANELGTTREELTAAQKTQANFNAILEEGAKISGVYGVAMGSPTKALRSLGREVYNLQAALGAPFLDAWATVVDIMRQFVQDATAAVSEGGSLYPVLVNIGAAASLLADGLRVGAEAVSNFIFSLVENFGANFDEIAYNALLAGSTIVANFATGMVDAIVPVLDALYQIEQIIVDSFSDDAANAIRFGAEIVVSLAEGIIQAASTVLVTAMNFIGSILTSWLAPGSPPKIIPDVDKWGAQAMAEYLKGFTEADFNVLERLQSAFQGALGQEGLAGVMDELLTAVDMGEVTDEMFTRLAQESGEYGTELATLTRLELDYASAIDKANQASEDLLTSQDDVAKATAEYNDLLRSGADEDALKAKLEEINAAEERVDLAKDEARIAAKSVDQIEDQTKAQRDLISQLNKFFKAQTQAPGAVGGAGAAAKGAAGIGAAIAEGFAVPEIDPSKISTRIGEAIELAKQRLLDVFTGPNSPFAPLILAWEQDIKPQLDRLMLTLFGGVVEGEPTEGLVQSFQTAALDIQAALGDIQTKFEEVSLFVGEKVATLKTAWTELTTAAEGLAGSAETIHSNFFEFLAPALEEISEIVNTITIPYFTSLAEMIGTTMGFATKVMVTIWQTILYPTLVMISQFVQESLLPLFEALREMLQVIVAKASEFLAAIWNTVLYPALEKVVQVTEKMNKTWEKFITELEDEFIPVLEFLGEIVLGAIATGFSGIRNTIKDIIDKVAEFSKAIMNIEIPWWLMPGSPPPLAMGLADIANQMDMIATRKIPALRSQLRAMDVVSPVSGGGNNMVSNSYSDQRQANFHVGNINTPMDQQTFEAMADRWWQQKGTGRTY